MRGWLTAPVVGDGAPFPRDKDGKNIVTPDRGPFRAAVSDRESTEGDRLEFVIGDGKPTCLVAYDVADASNFARFGGEQLAREDELDAAVGLVSGSTKLDALAAESGVEKTGSAREVLRRVGRVISPTFNERLHLGSSTAPKPGSFVEDTFTDADETLLTAHTGEEGAAWTLVWGPKAPSIKNNRTYDHWLGHTIASGLPAGTEYDIAADFYVPNLSATGIGISGRGSASVRTCYSAVHDGEKWILHRIEEGEFTELGSYVESPETGSTVSTVFAIRDATKKFYIAETERISSTDNLLSGAGRIGVETFGTFEDEGIQLTSITVTDVTVVGAPAATSTASAPTPTLSLTVAIQVEAASSNASAPAPSLSLTAVIQPEAASATASAPAPTLSLTTVVQAEVASSAASAPTPAVSVTVAVQPEAASATSSAPIPALSLTSVVRPEAASATASAPVPTVSGEVEVEIADVTIQRLTVRGDPRIQRLTVRGDPRIQRLTVRGDVVKR